EKRKSYSIGQEQIIVSQADKVKLRKNKEKKRSSTGGYKSKKRGRPKGCQNEVKTEPETPAYNAFKILLEKVFAVLIKIIP
ncbi:MAG: hypothetical protein NZ455_16780, partial [Bacteroidia bacterium]|nr:hypothetical protein [Bacteroidia bacterium]MDW8348612.1 hypothetical protein [Bacteroidia bacterium]